MKVYLYCTKGGESLSYDRETRKWVLSPKKNDDSVNGTVCAACDVNEASLAVFSNGKYPNPKGTCLTDGELEAYGKGKPLCFWKLENVLLLDPFSPQNLFKEHAQAHALERVPQSWCYCFPSINDYEKAVILSVRPKWLCKILNGEKTIEVRKSVFKGVEIIGFPREEEAHAPTEEEWKDLGKESQKE